MGWGQGVVPDRKACGGPRQEPGLPRRAQFPSPPLSQQEGRTIYFGAHEPVSPLHQGWDQPAQLLRDRELSPTCQRTKALDFSAWVRVPARVSLYAHMRAWYASHVHACVYI